MQSKRIGILQSCYIPWKGYFDIIGLCDTFVLYDDVQYRKNHWHNRNRIVTARGPAWLTIPISRPNGIATVIDAVEIAQPFSCDHWRAIEISYRQAPYFTAYAPLLERLYAQAGEARLLSEINTMFLSAIAELLGFRTQFVQVRSLGIEGGKTDRLVRICRTLGCGTYLSGPSARAYIDERQFDAAGVAIEWMDYGGYPAYGQQQTPFTPDVSILDMLFNLGPQTTAYMKVGAVGSVQSRCAPAQIPLR